MGEKKVKPADLETLLEAADISDAAKQELRRANGGNDERPEETRRPNGTGAATPPIADMPDL